MPNPWIFCLRPAAWRKARECRDEASGGADSAAGFLGFENWGPGLRQLASATPANMLQDERLEAEIEIGCSYQARFFR